MARKKLSSIESEFAGAELGDERRSRRLLRSVGRIAADPQKSLPALMGNDAELEGFYRFINSDAFSAEDVLDPHVSSTVDRCREEGTVLALHDTTQFDFPGVMREGMGRTTDGHKGFFAHVGLYVSEVASKPLGVGSLITWARGPQEKKKRRLKEGDGAKVNKESSRWLESVENIEEQRQDGKYSVIHVADSEGDFFELMSRISELQAKFVIRACQLARSVVSDGRETNLSKAIESSKLLGCREIELARRGQRVGGAKFELRRTRNRARAGRSAEVSIRVTSVRVLPTKDTRGPGLAFDVNVVHVLETSPPKGEPPVEWTLLTTEPVATKKAAWRVVDIYRKRWQIEEFFKCLKTGCSFEKRQVESYGAMLILLAMLAPIAYRLLLLRGLERDDPNVDAETAFSKVELYLLANGRERPVAIPKTIGEAMRLLAEHGGHLKRNGPPGWLTLNRGYEKLLALRLGWAMREAFSGKL